MRAGVVSLFSLAVVGCMEPDTQDTSTRSETARQVPVSAVDERTVADSTSYTAPLIEAVSVAQLATAPQLSQDISQSRHSAIVIAAARVAPTVVSINVARRQRQTAGRMR